MLRILTQERMAEISNDIYDDVVDFFCSIGYVIMNNAVDIDVSRHINLNNISNDYTAILDKKYKTKKIFYRSSYSYYRKG